MNKFLGFLCLILLSLPCHAALQYLPVQASSQAGMYDPRDPNSRGPYKVLSSNPVATTSAVQPAASSSYIVQLTRWGAPPNPYRVAMVNAQAYYRDAFTGVDFVAQAAANNDQWFVRAISPTADGASSTTQTDGPPLIFYSNVSGYQNCFYSPGWLYYICGSQSIYIEFDDLTQCDPAGNWTYQLLYNTALVDQRAFTMNLNVPPGDLPTALDQNPTKFGLTNFNYDDICKDTTTGKTVHCDPNNIPKNEPWQPYTVSAKGCAMTCTAMVADFHGAKIAESGLSALNDGLDTSGGYNRYGDVVWPGVVSYDATQGAQMQWIGFGSAHDDTGLRNNICRYGPQVMGVNKHAAATRPDHFVVAYGKIQNTMTSSWTLLDPDGGVKDTSSIYHDQNLGSRVYKGSSATYSFPLYGFQITLYSPAELVVTAPDGKEQTGFDPTSGTTYSGIPNAIYSGESLRDDDTGEADPDPIKFFYLPGPVTGNYTIQVIGTDTGTYSMKVSTLDSSGHEAAATELDDVPTFAGNIQQYTLDYQGSTSTPLTFEAGYAGGGQSKQVNGFLEYSSPAAARVKVSANVTSYRIVLQYGSTIVPTTFSATLNGNDVSNLFHPQSGTTETVTVPLQAGSNKLLFKIQGVETNGHTATDRDSFTLIAG
ncbi:MAG TPA: hypothetical protein VFX47_02885 [Gammaproteobacteria bacterium]|nr:hypothetical protein [Gammaproteobacteria bacterium]